MTTWTSFSTGAGAATTTWNYNPYRDWLDSKRYQNIGQGSLGPDYTYTKGGRLKSRKWARTGTSNQRIGAVYYHGFDDSTANNEHGDLLKIQYLNDPQATPTVEYTLDRQGRQKEVKQDTAVTTRTFNHIGTLLGETYSVSGPLAGLSVTNGYDQYLRRSLLHLRSVGALLAGTSVSVTPSISVR